MNESELRRLLVTKNMGRVPKTRPIPDVENLPLTKYSRTHTANQAKRSGIRKCYEEKATRTKLLMTKQRNEQFDEYKREDAEIEHINMLRERALKAEPPPMLMAWERKITLLVPQKLRNAFPTVFNALLDESKNEWDYYLKKLAVSTIIKEVPGKSRQRYNEKPFKFLGLTSNYKIFKKNKLKIKKILLLTHPFIRMVLETSEQMFPPTAINIAQYRSLGAQSIETIIQNVESDLKRTDSLISCSWYGKITASAKQSRPLRVAVMGQEKLGHFVTRAVKIISRQIEELVRNSMNAVIDALSSVETIPILKISLDFDKKRGFIFIPSLKEIYEHYHFILDLTKGIGQKLLPLEYYLKLPFDEDVLEVKYNEWLNNDCHERLQNELNKVFQPLLDYKDVLMEQYRMLHDVKDNNDIIDFISSNKDFAKGIEKIRYIRQIGSDITSVTANTYFDAAQVSQIPMIESLKKRLKEFDDNIIAALVDKHIAESEDICREFESIALEASKSLKTAAELNTQGAYIVQAKTVILESLKARISDQLKINSRLLELTTLSPEHIELNARTVNWLSKIKPIFDKNASDFEALKVEMEENLKKSICRVNDILNNLLPKLVILDFMDDINHTFEYLEQLRKMTLTLKNCDSRVKAINREEAAFKFPISNYSELEELKDFIINFHNLVYLVHKWRRSYFTWMDGPFEYLDHEQIETDHDYYYKEFLKLNKIYKNKIKTMISEDNERRFKGFPDDQDINNMPAPMKLCTDVLTEIKKWQPNVTIAHIMCNPALRQRHWDEMSLIAKFDLTPNAGTSLRKIIEYNIWDSLDQYEIISFGATKELALITNLNNMKEEWNDIRFKTSLYKDTGIYVLSGLDDIQSILDDHIVKTIGMRGSAFVKPFRAEVQAWWEKINTINQTIDEWGKVQSQWLYLLPIFSSEDIVAQMPEESAKFQQVNLVYRRYLSEVHRDPIVINLAGSIDVLEAFKVCSELLEDINNGVYNYLEKKRLYFTRFFFMSNDEMLEILSETKNPLKVQPHLKKCFEGVNKLTFTSTFDITAMVSQEEETVDFVETVSVEAARGSVEKWLVQVENQMVKAVKSETELSYYEFPTLDRSEWLLSWEGMVVLAVSQIYWAIDVHNCLKTHKLSELISFHESLKTQLLETVTIMRTPTLTVLQSITVKALIVIDVHAKDVVQDLIEKKVTEDIDFQWLAQLRYYWEDEKVSVKIINAAVEYKYEYLGNSDRLVITPLTDRCYRTLIGAYSLHLNGAPEGPAGTGKTETTKDLAKALAVQCVVFNCSDGLDYKAMGKFFKGVAACGAWICFDEFNRIEVEVLSVIAQQILCIIQAVRAKVEQFDFEGTTLILNPACYVCITMNPGYAGRSELPDNLKVLFRTVAMMVPDYAMIGEISLYSFGFSDARNLSVKIVTTYRLCSEQLSSQNHYDYGMRAVKTVLCAAGHLKKAFPNENESILLLRSIKDVNLAKFLSFDVPLFNGIISDLFPGVKLPNPDYKILLKAATETCESLCLQPIECFFTKIVQTYEMMIVRHGFMLVGDPFSGKSTTLKVLSMSLTLMGEKEQPGGLKAIYKVFNPKAVTMGQLFGAFDSISYEWTDGIVATAYRDFASDDSLTRKWIVFDGPVDPVWIENMNTVLDDNKKLCLTSGEVITMTNSMTIIFETANVDQASPATVSRCGMIYMESSSYGFRPFYLSWLKTLNPLWAEENEDFVYDLCEWLIEPLMTFVRKNCIQLVSGGEVNRVMTTLKLITSLMDRACESEKDARYTKSWILASFMTGCVWGIGGLLNIESRERFDEVVKQFFKSERGVPSEVSKHLDVSIPNEGMIIDHCYLYKHKGCWRNWTDLIKTVQIIEKTNLLQTVIPTVESEKYAFLLQLHVRFGIPFLLIGPTGTGKSFYIQENLMNRINMDSFWPGFIAFSATTSANQCQDLVINKLNKLRKNIYGPGKGKKAIIFIDDMNMPAKEEYGAQPPIELLRLFLDQGHWYDLKTTEKLWISDTVFFAAIGPVGGSRQLICPRLLRHFNMFSINEFANDSMSKIFTNLLQLCWRRNGFGQEVQANIVQIVGATTALYEATKEELRPTPAKSHYIFNLRDILKVIQGCGLLRKESVDNKKIFVRIWIHEILRVFYDRLVDKDDRLWFFNLLKQITADVMKESIGVVLDSYLDETEDVSLETIKKLMFGTFMDTDNIEGERRYEELTSKEAFFNLSVSNLIEYNSQHKRKLQIVLFNYALEHLSKICRILSMPSGNALLVGLGGSGRKSLAQLAGFSLGQPVRQPQITENYSTKDWTHDLKIVLKESGGHGKNTTFLFSDNQIKDEVFIQNLDSLLNSGEVPNIYSIDEKQEIIELCRLGAQGGNRNLDVSPLQVFSFFIGRVKIKLHLVLCFSPIGRAFHTRLRLYPSLVNCCTIDWYDDWPEEALEAVAHFYMGKVNFPDSVKISAVSACKQFHIDARSLSLSFFSHTGRRTYITSASYLNLIQCFAHWTKKKQKELTAARLRYTNGLAKIEQAAEAVTIMHQNLNILKPQLIVMAENSSKMMEIIEKETTEADVAAAQVREDQQIANFQAAEAQHLKKDCEADLALALPILEDAIAALNTLKPTDITLVKSMKNPPAAIKLVMAAVCVIKGVPPDKVPDPANPGKKALDFWAPSKRILGDMNFLDSLKNFDKDNIPLTTMAKIRKDYLPHKDFQPHIIAKASTAAEGLCKWIIAMNMYDTVAKVVGPKKAKLNAAEKEFADTMAILEEKKATVARLEKKLKELNESLEDANLKKQELENQVKNCMDKLCRAEKLISGLGGEKERWTLEAENLQIRYDYLAGDLLVSCGIIAYLGPYTFNLREETIDKWCKLVQNLEIPHSQLFSLRDILGTDIKIQTWNISGLPRDCFSIENAIIQDCSMKWSLLIDPQGQANMWIKNMEKNNDLQTMQFSDDYMKILETCLEFGKPALIENIFEDLKAPLNPLLEKNTFRQGDKVYIAIGDNLVPYHSRFRLYMTTKLRNPQFSPEVFIKTTLINFALTKDGLENQLLGIVVAKERYDLEEKREMLDMEAAANRVDLKNVEDDILRILQETKGDILEDETAVEVLDSSKLLSKSIMKKQEASYKTVHMIETFRQRYRPVAHHAAILYYCITELPNVDPMYQFSLSWFINLYVLSIQHANKSKDLEKRLRYLNDTFTFDLYSNVCRGIFDKDKLMFSFIMCSKMMIASDQITFPEFSFLISGSVVFKHPYNKLIDWLSDRSWDDLCILDNINNFVGIKQDFCSNTNKWRKIYDSDKAHKCPLPNRWNTDLTSFQKLLVIKIIRPDLLSMAISEFVEKQMGKKFIVPPNFDLTMSFANSNFLTPLIFILSPGSDPMGNLLNFCDRMGYANKLNSISLGQGQGPIARAIMKTAQLQGGWVCLQNCHLAVSWLPTLEKVISTFNATNTDMSFRLWLTSYPTEFFPQSILQNGIKITNEPPTGLKHNLTRSYLSEPLKEPEFYSGCPGKEKAFSKLLYGISFFHAVVQERKKFGPLGWNIQYEFNDSDFQISVMQLQKFLNQYEEVQYVAIKYLTGECNYGGRVTDDWDRRLIVTILDDFVNPDVVRDQNYLFSDIGSEYGLPRRCEYKDFLKHIENIDANPSPEVFGLHGNARMTRDFNMSMALIESLCLVESLTFSERENTDQVLLKLSGEILSKLPECFNIETVQQRYPVNYNESMNTVLIQEMGRYNKLIVEITNSLRDIQKAVEGLIVLSPSIDLQCSAMLSSKIPQNWMKFSYPSLKPLPSYITDLLERLSMLQNWYDNGIPSTFWLSGFVFTQAVLTGAMQNYARANKIAIDKLVFDFRVREVDYEPSPAKPGIYVHRLMMDGARWDRKMHTIAEQLPKILYDNMPVIWLFPKLKDLFTVGDRYKCPLYKTLERKGVLATTGHSSNFVTAFYLPSRKTSSHWTKRSVALLLQLSD